MPPPQYTSAEEVRLSKLTLLPDCPADTESPSRVKAVVSGYQNHRRLLPGLAYLPAAAAASDATGARLPQLAAHTALRSWLTGDIHMALTQGASGDQVGP